jgi:hypothetical protein
MKIKSLQILLGFFFAFIYKKKEGELPSMNLPLFRASAPSSVMHSKGMQNKSGIQI